MIPTGSGESWEYETDPAPGGRGSGHWADRGQMPAHEYSEATQAPWQRPAGPRHGYPAPQQTYRDPWLTGGWFARLSEDSASEQPEESAAQGRRWLIFVILLIQAALAIRLFRANTNFQDEGLYLWAGYLQAGHHALPSQVQGLETWFSGSPALYPRLGALAAQFGGLTGARLLSLMFMLLATTALYAVTCRLWSSRVPALFAAALFGWLGSAEFLGAFATYDAMALALLAVATWLGVRAATCRAPARLTLLLAVAAVLLAANATKYMSLLFDPVVIAVICLAIWRLRGWGSAFASASVLTVTTAVLVLGAYELSGADYQAGIKFSTLTRAIGDTSPDQVLSASGRWIGLLVVLAIVAAIVVTWRQRDFATALLAWTLTAAAFLTPLQEARLHTTVSLYKHVGFGAWFASIAAGWLLGSVAQSCASAEGSRRLKQTLCLGAAVAAVAASAAIGVVTSGTQYHDWPNSNAAAATLARLVTPRGEYLAEDYDQFTYTLRRDIPLPQWWNTWSFNYTNQKTQQQLTNSAAYAAAIRDRYFSVIVLDFQDTIGTDRDIEQDIKKYDDYRLAATVPFITSAGPGEYLFWVPIPKPARQLR